MMKKLISGKRIHWGYVGRLALLALACLVPGRALAQASYALSFLAADVAFQPGSPYVFVTSTNKLLVRMNVTDGAVSQYVQPYMVESLAMRSDGQRLYVFQLPRGHNSYYTDPATNYVAEYDTATMTKLRDLTVQNDARRMVVTDKGLLVLSAAYRYNSGYLSAYRLSDGSRTSYTYDYYSQNQLILPPDQDRLYAGYYGNSIFRYDIDPVSGAVASAYEFYRSSYQHGNYLFAHPNGTNLLTQTGYIVQTSTNRTYDIVYGGILESGPVEAVAFDLPRHGMFVASGTKLHYYNSDSLRYVASQSLAAGPKVLGVVDTNVVAVVITNSQTTVWLYPNPAVGAENNLAPSAWFTLSDDAPAVGVPFDVDASGSDDEEPASLMCRWDWEGDGIFDTPFTSQATATYSFATAGSRQVTVQVKDRYGMMGTFSRTVNVRLGAGNPAVAELPFPAAKVIFDEPRNVAYASVPTNKALYVLNLSDGLVAQKFSFDYPVEALAMTPNGHWLYAFLLPNGHPTYYYNAVTNYIAEIDLDGMAQTRLIKVSNDAYEMQALDNGLLILGGGYLSTYYASNGVRVANSAFGSSIPGMAMLPGADNFCYVYSSSIYRYRVNLTNGTIASQVSRSLGSLGNRLFPAPSGTYLLAQGGQVLASSTNAADDLVFLRSLDAGAAEGAAFDAERHSVFTVSRTNLVCYNGDSWEMFGSQPVKDSARYVAAFGTNLVVVSITTNRTFFQWLNNPAEGAQTNLPPTAQFTFDPPAASSQDQVSFDASGTSDDAGLGQLQYRWDWEGDGLFDTAFSTNATAQHQFNLAGTNLVVLQVKDNFGAIASATQALVVAQEVDPGWPGGTNVPWQLPFAATQLLFDPLRPFGYAISQTNRLLDVMNLTNGLVEREFRFCAPPVCLAMTPNAQRLYAILLPKGHPANYYNPVANFVAEFDLAAMVKLREFTVTNDVYGAAATDGGLLIFSSYYLSVYRATDGACLASRASSASVNSPLALLPSRNLVYLQSSSYTYPYAIDPATGALTSYSSYYYYEYPYPTNLFGSPDGKYLITQRGRIYGVNEQQPQSLANLGALANPAADGVFFDPAHQVLLTVGSNKLSCYNSASLLPLGSQRIAANVRYVGAVGEQVVVAAVTTNQTLFQLVEHPAAGALGNTAPVAAFVCTPTNATTADSVVFDAGASSDREDADALVYRWDWEGDGTFDTAFSGEPTAAHRYTLAGTKFAVLQVRDPWGSVATITQRVDVGISPEALLPGSTNTGFVLPCVAADVVFDPLRPLAYVADKTNRALVVVNLASGMIEQSYGLAFGPELLALRPDGSRLYAIAPTASTRTNMVMVFNPEARTWEPGFAATNTYAYSKPYKAVATDSGFLILNSDILNVYWASNGVMASQLSYDGGTTLFLHPSQEVFFTSTYYYLNKFRLAPTNGAIWEVQSFYSETSAGYEYFGLCHPNGNWLITQGGRLLACSGGDRADTRWERPLEGGPVEGGAFDIERHAFFGAAGGLLSYYNSDQMSLASQHAVLLGTRFIGFCASNMVAVAATNGFTYFQLVPNPAIGQETNQAPVAKFHWWPAGDAAVGDLVYFMGTDSTDDQGGTRLSYRWDMDGDGIFEIPYTRNPNRSQKFEQAGTQRITLQVKDRYGVTATASQLLQVAATNQADFGIGAAWRLPFPAADVVFDPIRPYAYASGYSNRCLAMLNLTNGVVEKWLALEYPVESLAISPNGAWLCAAMPIMAHGYSYQSSGSNAFSGFVALVDLASQTITRQFPVASDPLGLAVTDAGLVLVSDGSYPYACLKSYRAETGALLDSYELNIYNQAKLAMNPQQTTVYLIGPDSYLYAYRCNPTNGALSWLGGDDAGSACDQRLFFHAGGSNLIVGSGAVLTNGSTGLYLNVRTNLAGGGWQGMAEASSLNLLLAVGEEGYHFYQTDTLGWLGGAQMPRALHFAGWSGGRFYAGATSAVDTLFYPLLAPATNAADNLSPQPVFVGLTPIVPASNQVAFLAAGNDTDGWITNLTVVLDYSLVVAQGTNDCLAVTLTDLAPGEHVLQIIAQDNWGTFGTNIIAITANLRPTVTIGGQGAYTYISPMTNLTLTAEAKDADGQVVSVSFYDMDDGNRLLGVATTSPWSATNVLNYNPNNSYHEIVAVAQDNAGLCSTSSYATIVLVNPPTVTITTPANYAAFTAPALVMIKPSPYSNPTEYYVNGVLVGATNYAYYGYPLSFKAPGTYELKVKYYDSYGGWAFSPAVYVIVRAAPSLVVAAPDNELIVPAGSSLPVSVVASNDMGIRRLEVLLGKQVLAATNRSPLAVTLTNLPAGHLPLDVRMTDKLGAVVHAPLVHVYGSCNQVSQVPRLPASLRNAAGAFLVDSAGRLWSWGDGGSGGLGTGNETDQWAPTEVPKIFPPGVTHWLACAGGLNFGAAIGDNSALYTWGGNSYGQLGNGASGANQVTFGKVMFPLGVTSWQRLQAGRDFMLVLGNNGQLYAWGNNANSQLGIGVSSGTRTLPVPVSLPAGVTNWIDVAAGRDHCMAIGGDGNLYGWGNGSYGKLGNNPNTGSTTNKPSLVIKPAEVNRWVEVAVGENFTIGVGDNGQMYFWGYGNYGQTGDGTTYYNYYTPRQIPPLDEVRSWATVVAGQYFCLALSENGQLYGWGDNRAGQVSATISTYETRPYYIAPPLGANGWVAIAASDSTAYGLTDDGRLLAWGANAAGQLGLGHADTALGLNVVSNQSNVFYAFTNLAPAIELVGLQPTNFFLAPASFNLAANVTDAGGKVVRVEFFAESNRVGYFSQAPYYLSLADQPTNEYHFRIMAVDNLRATNFLDVVTVVLADFPTTIQSVSPTNSLSVSQRGLFTQTVSVNNPTAMAFSAVRLLVTLDAASLANGVRVYNATGTNTAGTPFLQYNQPLPGGKTVDFLIEYYIPDRRTVPAPTLAVEVVPAAAPFAPVGTALAIDRVVPMADGSSLVEFSTLTNRIYFLQYSPDMATWKTAQPAILGTGSRIQWFDNGPPKTESLPAGEAMRFYRLLLLP